MQDTLGFWGNCWALKALIVDMVDILYREKFVRTPFPIMLCWAAYFKNKGAESFVFP